MIGEACDRIGFHRPVDSMKPISAPPMHPLRERWRVEKKGEYEEGLFPKRIKQESLS